VHAFVIEQTALANDSKIRVERHFDCPHVTLYGEQLWLPGKNQLAHHERKVKAVNPPQQRAMTACSEQTT
jgi:hypothetical protein